MINRVRNTGVLGYGLIGKVDLAVCVNSYVLKESVTLDSCPNIRLIFLGKVKYLSVAADLEVEYAFVVPAVLVITDE